MPAEVLKRHGDRPVLEPRPGRRDAASTFNPGAILVGEKVHMLYRAVTDLKPYVSRFGLAVSADGVHFERAVDEPVFSPRENFEVGGVEDARITRNGEDFLITYAAVSVVPGPVYEAVDFFSLCAAGPVHRTAGHAADGAEPHRAAAVEGPAELHL